jgi:hypothetical protein
VVYSCSGVCGRLWLAIGGTVVLFAQGLGRISSYSTVYVGDRRQARRGQQSSRITIHVGMVDNDWSVWWWVYDSNGKGVQRMAKRNSENSTDKQNSQPAEQRRMQPTTKPGRLACSPSSTVPRASSSSGS